MKPPSFEHDDTVMRKLLSVKKGAKCYYYILTSSEIDWKFKRKWEECMLVEFDWEKIFLKSVKTTKDTKLRWFQFRIIHGILSTNSFLCKIKLAENNLCTFCQNEVETISHLFWYCEHVQLFWKYLLKLLKNDCHHAQNMKLDLQLVIFGTSPTIYTDDVFDLILLLAKFFIYKCKVLKTTLNFKHFQKYLQDRYLIEKIISYNRCEHEKFLRKWMLYHDIVK